MDIFAKLIIPIHELKLSFHYLERYTFKIFILSLVLSIQSTGSIFIKFTNDHPGSIPFSPLALYLNITLRLTAFLTLCSPSAWPLIKSHSFKHQVYVSSSQIYTSVLDLSLASTHHLHRMLKKHLKLIMSKAEIKNQLRINTLAHNSLSCLVSLSVNHSNSNLFPGPRLLVSFLPSPFYSPLMSSPLEIIVKSASKIYFESFFFTIFTEPILAILIF